MSDIRSLFIKPLDRSINGVVKADQQDTATIFQELDEYVITRELEKHFKGFFDVYNTQSDDKVLANNTLANNMGVWISGFFGSGKSHFLKILSYLLANQVVRDTAGESKQAIDFFDEQKVKDDSLLASIRQATRQPTEVILFNIDSKANANDNEGNAILNVFLQVFNESLGYCGMYPHIAHMERHLDSQGVFNKFKQTIATATGKEWAEVRDEHSFYQDNIEMALTQVLDMTPESAHRWFENSERDFKISPELFSKWVKAYLDTKPKDYRILFLVDEIGQFIGNNSSLMLTLQTITENLGTVCQGRAWVIVTSQADMDAVIGEVSSSRNNDFSKITARFTTRLSLSSSNTDEVIQQRLLDKTPSARAELAQVFEKQGDILKNQLTFDQAGHRLKAFDTPESFIVNYPFAPYQFQVVQKIFEEIRKIGATGSHLSKGERSMLDAFQLASKSIANEPIGALVPLYRFYQAVEGFLEPTVKRTIETAGDIDNITPFDVEILRTLFMIRYIDLVKGTLDNLVTLSIEKIDEDKLLLRQKIEETLQRLDKENLITHNGEVYQFLTNEERDISKQIKATDITTDEENSLLGILIFKDILKDTEKFTYKKSNYELGRFVDGRIVGRANDYELKVEIISPNNSDYKYYTDAECINLSHIGDNNKGQIIVRLSDDNAFFRELKTYLRTEKYLRLNTGSQPPEIEAILHAKSLENQERKKRLHIQIETLLLDAEVFSLGQVLTLKGSSVTSRFQESYQYLLENTYTKLSYLEIIQDDANKTLQALLTNPNPQLGFAVTNVEDNARALKEALEFIQLKSSGNERVALVDVLQKFGKRPYGWHDNEILLLVARLMVTGQLSLQANGNPLLSKEAYDMMVNTRRRSEVSINRKRQTEPAVLESVRKLSNDLFSEGGLAPTDEKALFAHYQQQLLPLRDKLKNYLTQSNTSQHPLPFIGLVTESIEKAEKLLAYKDSYDFFEHIMRQKNDYLDWQEDLEDVHEFYGKFVPTWQEMQLSLVRFSKNERALAKESDAETALSELKSIATQVNPNKSVNKIHGLIEQVNQINNRLIEEERERVIRIINDKIGLLTEEIKKFPVASAELSNQLLLPLQNLKKSLASIHSIADIAYTIKDADNYFEDGLEALHQAVIKQEQANLALTKAHSPTTSSTLSSSKTEVTMPATSIGKNQVISPLGVSEPSVSTYIVSRPVDIKVKELYSQMNLGVYLENEQAVETFITQLKSKLLAQIEQNHKIRIV